MATLPFSKTLSKGTVMKIQISQKMCREIGKYIIPRIPKKSSLSILESVLIEQSTTGLISVTCTDLDEYYTYTDNENDSVNYDACKLVIPVKACKILFTKNAKHNLVLDVDNYQRIDAKIDESGFVRAVRFSGMNVEAYPNIFTDDVITDAKQFKLNSVSKFMDKVKSFTPFTHNTKARATGHVYVGTHCAGTEQYPQMVATDGKRLVYTILDWPKTDMGCLIPTTKTMLGKYPDSPGMFTVYKLYDRQICTIHSNNFSVRFKVYDGVFPNYTQAIPNYCNDHKLYVPITLREEFKRVEKVGNVYALFNSSGCTLKFPNSGINIPISYDTKLPADFSLTFYPKLLREILDLYDHDIVFDCSRDPHSPIMVKDDVTMVLMPLIFKV